MAVANVETFSLLNAWPRLMHEDFYRFNQIGGNGVRLVPGCASPTYIQYERDSIASALYDAVQRSADYFGFYPRPTWVEDEVIDLRSGANWDNQTLETRWGYLVEFGKRATTAITSNVNVVYDDPDGDGVFERASVTVTTTVADDELQVFFRTADGAVSAAHEYWRIEPLNVVSPGDGGAGTKTLRGHRSLFAHPNNVWSKEYVSPNFYEKFQGDTADVNSFVVSVDVYRVYNNPSVDSVTLLSDPRVATPATQNVSAWVDDSQYGQFTLRKTNVADPDPPQPLAVRVSYRAGFPLQKGAVDRRLEVALTRYANTIMPYDLGFCDKTMSMWVNDRELPDAISQQEAENPPPFGFTKGGLFAWGVRNALFLKGKAREPEVVAENE